jgi:hypothetical protein
MTNLLLIALGVVVIGLMLGVATQAFKLIFKYKITNDKIVALLFHVVPIYIIPFGRIEGMRQATFYEVALVPGMHLFTRPFGKRVVIEMKDRWAKFAFLTPSDPTAFIDTVKRRM